MTGPQDESPRDRGERAVPYVCPFCGEEDLRPVEDGRWHCSSCLRLFTVAFFGLRQPGTAYPPPASAAPPPTPAAGIRLVDPDLDRPDDRTTPGSPR